MSRAGRRPSRQRGFTYVAVLTATVVLSILAGVASTVTARVAQAEREAELLFRGKAYRDAIKSYYEARGLKAYPRTLDDLLKDPRFPNRRHIRALYADPFAEWTLVRAADGGIAGVASRSDQEPMKKANFPAEFSRFAGAARYSDWVFEYHPAANKNSNRGTTE